jgi:prepilin-type N-terminal cleavage/methylation domain-containing protein/prepilin-type processing-associated H-X9-DG protein
MRRYLSHGFTLIELLVVVAIIAILATLLFPVFEKAQHKSQQVCCINNQRQISIAISMWSQDHDNVFPSRSEAWTGPEIDAGIKMCPSDEAKDPIGYVYNEYVAGKTQTDLPFPDEELLIADGPGKLSLVQQQEAQYRQSTEQHLLADPNDIDYARHDTGFITCYCDGHVSPGPLSYPPPMWIFPLPNLNRYGTEIIHYPGTAVLLLYKARTNRSPDPEKYFSDRIVQLIKKDLAKRYRLHVKFVLGADAALPELLTEQGVIAGDPLKGLPTLLIYDNGNVVGGITGFPDNTTQWTGAQWDAQVAGTRAELVKQLDKVL